jgi:hypothetical protein
VTRLGPTLLAGTDILYINHLISDSLMVARGFKRLGTRLTSIAIPYSGIYGPVQRAVHEGFKHLGSIFLPGSPTPASSPRRCRWRSAAASPSSLGTCPADWSLAVWILVRRLLHVLEVEPEANLGGVGGGRHWQSPGSRMHRQHIACSSVHQASRRPQVPRRSRCWTVSWGSIAPA